MFGMGMDELQQILISVLAISLAFTIANTRGEPITPAGFAILFIIILISVGLGFILHEMGHRFIARRYGAYSVYQMWPQGLMFALLTSMFGIVFAAPGAVYIYAVHLTRRQNGLISLAGPVMNLVLAVAFFLLGIAVLAAFPENQYANLLIAYGIGVNVFLAFFNLIPIFPLDGSKVLAWNPLVWFALFALTGAFIFFPTLFGL